MSFGSQLVAFGQWSIVIGLFVVYFGPVLPGLVRDWSSESGTYSYGFLVPLIAAYLLWQRRHVAGSLPVAANYAASLVLFLAVLLALLGQSVGDSYLPRWSMIIAGAATVWFLLGNRWMRALAFPIYYLSLMIPVPYFLVKDLTFYLRYSDATLAANILTLFGYPVYLDSYFLHLPNITLEVADVCSGVSSIFALFALGVIYARFLPLRNSLKLVLIASTLPFAVLSNLFRIVFTAILAYHFGPIVMQTTFHAFSGTFTFVVALIMLISLGEAFRKRSFAESQKPRLSVTDQALAAHSPVHWIVPRPAFVLYVAILGTGIYLSDVLDNPRKMTVTSDLDSIAIGSAASVRHLAPEDHYQDRHAQDVLSRNISLHDGTPVHLFVAYSGAQGAATRLNSPKLIFPDNWNSVWIRESQFMLPGRQTVHGNWMLTRKSDTQQLVFYWYQLGDKTIAGEVESRLTQMRRAFAERRTDMAVVRLSTIHREGEGLELAQQRLSSVIAELYPQLVKRLPA